MAAKGEVRVVSYVGAGDITGMRRAARGAGGRTERVTVLRPPNQPGVEIVTVLPSQAGFTLFRDLVEADSRAARERRGTPPVPRRLSPRAA